MPYFDNAATTRPLMSAMKLLGMDFTWGNPSSRHHVGLKSRETIDKCRDSIKSALGAKNGDIIFTSGGTESNNLALFGIVDYLKQQNKDAVITSCIEHPSVKNVMKKLEAMGFEVIYMGVDYRGKVSIEDLEYQMDLLGNRLGLVSIQMVNSEIGTKQDLESIGASCHKRGVLFHTDAVQGVGRYRISIDDCYIDMLSMSGHKIHAFKGVGVLYVRDKTLLTPIIQGGGQQYGLRSGTENVLGILSMKNSVDEVLLNPEVSVIEKMMRDGFTKKLEEAMKIPYFINNKECTNGIVSITIPKVEGTALMMLLDNDGFCVSTGSACSSNSLEASYVLKSIGLDKKTVFCTIRVSIDPFENSSDDCIRLANAIVQRSKELYDIGQG